VSARVKARFTSSEKRRMLEVKPGRSIKSDEREVQKLKPGTLVVMEGLLDVKPATLREIQSNATLFLNPRESLNL
jgi:hypothetical protein